MVDSTNNEPFIVNARKRCAKDFIGFEKVMHVSSREMLAGIAITSGVEGRKIA